jgi:hypothetical protein
VIVDPGNATLGEAFFAKPNSGSTIVTGEALEESEPPIHCQSTLLFKLPPRWFSMLLSTTTV